jgi:hypothetical protein
MKPMLSNFVTLTTDKQEQLASTAVPITCDHRITAIANTTKLLDPSNSRRLFSSV